MKELSEHVLETRVDTLTEAVHTFDERLARIERQVAARMLMDYPHRGTLGDLAEALRTELGSQAVQINSIDTTSQTTIVAAPPTPESAIPVYDSLCVMTVGLGEPAAVSDIANDPVVDGHPVREVWGSWASAPIVITGMDAGSVCGLETEARTWSDRDQDRLVSMAARIATEVETWIGSDV